MREPVHEFFKLNYLSESKRESQKNRKYLFECINTVKITVKIGHGTRGLVNSYKFQPNVKVSTTDYDTIRGSFNDD